MSQPERNPDKSERAVARRAASGDRDAWADLVEAHWNRAYQLHLLATDDPHAARLLSEATFEDGLKEIETFLRDDEPFARWIAALCRETARRRLEPDDWRATPWSQGQEILTDPPEALRLPQEALHKGASIPEQDLQEALAPLSLGHQLFTRLFFVEDFPVGRLAGVLSASSAFVSSFLYGLLDQLGSLETLEFEDGDGPAGISLASETLEARQDHEGLRNLLRTHAGCEGSSTLIFRTIRLAEALSRDPTPAEPPPPALLEELRSQAPAESPEPGTPARPPPPRVIPLQSKPEARSHHDRRLQLAFAATLLLFFVGGVYAILGGRPGPRPRIVAAFEDEDQEIPEDRLVGYYASLSGRRHVLQSGKRLQASPLGSTAITLHSGARLLLTPHSAMMALGPEIQLQSGKLLAFLDGLSGKGGQPFHLSAGGARLVAPGGTVSASGHPDRGALLAIKGSSGKVHLPNGQAIDLEPFRALRLAPDGSYQIEDAAPELFSERGAPTYLSPPGEEGAQIARAGGGGGGSSGGQGPLPGGRYRIRSGPLGRTTSTAPEAHSGETGLPPGTPPRNSRGSAQGGPMRPSGRVRPGTVRGFRDAF